MLHVKADIDEVKGLLKLFTDLPLEIQDQLHAIGYLTQLSVVLEGYENVMDSVATAETEIQKVLANTTTMVVDNFDGEVARLHRATGLSDGVLPTNNWKPLADGSAEDRAKNIVDGIVQIGNDVNFLPPAAPPVVG